jgi:hypothetical protein
MDPRLYDATAIASGFVPGSGLMDFIGQAPAIGGGMGPSFMQNIRNKQYIDAMLQMAGAAGDAMMVVPPVGMTVKAATTAGKTARAGSKTADALDATKKAAKAVEAPAVITQPKSNYLVNTPKNQNPLVGTRYKTEQLPGKLADRRPVNYDELLGASLMTFPTDMLSRHVRVNEISNIPLDRPFETVGGLTYMSDLENMKNLIGYASNKAQTTSQTNRALQAIQENIARGGTGRVFVAPHTMPRSGENFSTSPTQGLLSLIDTVGMPLDLAGEISDRIREATVKGVKGKYKDFVGIGDSGLMDQLMTGAGLQAGSPGDLRKVFVDKMSSAAAEKGLGFNYQDLQNAILDTNVMNKQPFLMGDSIYEALPHLGTKKGVHPAYSHDTSGLFAGNTRGAPVSEVMGSLYQRLRKGEEGKPGSGGRDMDPDQLTRGKLSTAGEDISLFLDEAEIARLKRLFGDQ